MSLFIKNSSNWLLSGPLDFTNVTQIENKVHKAFKDITLILNLDLGNTKEIDSAGIALLLSIIHHCKSSNTQLQFLNLNSENAKELITIYGLNTIFTPLLQKNFNQGKIIMNKTELKSVIEKKLGNNTNVIIESDDNVHFNAIIISSIFKDTISKVKQQQLVYDAIDEYIASGELHAITMKTYTPEKWLSLNKHS